jgi:EAL domain-containing protein (putative c-di-GMP-specific phosphodiesterase class I)
LVRWQHPRMGFVSPGMFVPIAEECGLIDRLDMWVLKQACAAAIRWNSGQFVAVNISSLAFQAPGLANRALAVIRESGLAMSRVQIEITETALLKSENIAATEVKALRSAGVTVALDDFGTGYSSLSHLQTLDVDKIKIDKSFVEQSYTPEAVAIISAVITLGRSMGVEITAEGVETEAQAQFLRAAGCTVLQGYLFGRPMSEIQLDMRERNGSLLAKTA